LTAAHTNVLTQAARVEHDECFGEQMEEAVRWQGCVTSGLEWLELVGRVWITFNPLIGQSLG
jgi:hypothetical protein